MVDQQSVYQCHPTTKELEVAFAAKLDNDLPRTESQSHRVYITNIIKNGIARAFGVWAVSTPLSNHPLAAHTGRAEGPPSLPYLSSLGSCNLINEPGRQQSFLFPPFGPQRGMAPYQFNHSNGPFTREAI